MVSEKSDHNRDDRHVGAGGPPADLPECDKEKMAIINSHMKRAGIAAQKATRCRRGEALQIQVPRSDC
jgi:hypothetical protein